MSSVRAEPYEFVFQLEHVALVVIDKDDIVVEVREASARDQSHISGTDDRDAHVQNSTEVKTWRGLQSPQDRRF